MLAVDLLAQGVAPVLMSYVADTTVGTAVSAGTQTFTPPVSTGLFPGAIVVAGYGAASQEQVEISAQSGGTFTATFANDHAAADVLYGPTFPEGYPDKQLWTTAEMLEYLVDAQGDLCLDTRLLVAQAGFSFGTGQWLMAMPADALYLDRVSVAGVEVVETTREDLDLSSPGWRAESGSQPLYYWQDGARQSSSTGTGRFGLNPIPSVGNSGNLYYSQAGPTSLELTDALSVPDPTAYILKYGTLARAFIKDGEQRDPARAAYCRKRAEWGGRMVNLFMQNNSLDPKEIPPWVPLQLRPSMALQ